MNSIWQLDASVWNTNQTFLKLMPIIKDWCDTNG